MRGKGKKREAREFFSKKKKYEKEKLILGIRIRIRRREERLDKHTCISGRWKKR